MEIFRKVCPVMMLLLCFIRNTRCQFCKAGVPVARVCTDDSQISTRNVYIDTVSVPRYEIITCKCEISTSGINETFVFVYSGNTDHTWFKLNEHYIYNQYRAYIYDTADLSFTTNDSILATGCLSIYTVEGTIFNVKCSEATTRTTTDPVRPRTSYSSNGITSVSEALVEQDGNSEHETDIIIPVVAPIASVVCLVGVVALVVVCRRRSLKDNKKSETSSTAVEREKKEAYYLTVIDSEPNIPSAKSEYHNIEAENQGESMPDSQYESLSDKRNNSDLRYEYITCVS